MEEEDQNKNHQEEKPLGRAGRQANQSVLLLGAVSALITMPLFIILYKFFPAINIPIGDHEFKLGLILLFLALFFAIYFLLKKFKIIVYSLLILGLLVLTITNFSGYYTMTDLYHDYERFLFSLSDNSLIEEFDEFGGKFRKEKELRAAIDYNEPDVRNYAASIAIKHFEEETYLSPSKKWVQFFSVFKEINDRWKYVNDPANEDYYSKASQTLKQLDYDGYFKGDCDDYSIMMAACIKAIGGEVRLVRTEVEMSNGKTVGHLYPEVKFGEEEDFEAIIYLIKNIYFVEESRGEKIRCYEDSKGFIWLNFDYNDPFPGGRYQSNTRKSEIII